MWLILPQYPHMPLFQYFYLINYSFVVHLSLCLCSLRLENLYHPVFRTSLSITQRQIVNQLRHVSWWPIERQADNEGKHHLHAQQAACCCPFIFSRCGTVFFPILVPQMNSRDSRASLNMVKTLAIPGSASKNHIPLHQQTSCSPKSNSECRPWTSKMHGLS